MSLTKLEAAKEINFTKGELALWVIAVVLVLIFLFGVNITE